MVSKRCYAYAIYSIQVNQKSKSYNNSPTLAKSQCKSYRVILKLSAIVCSALASISMELTTFVRANASVSQKKSRIMRKIENIDMATPILVAYKQWDKCI